MAKMVDVGAGKTIVGYLDVADEGRCYVLTAHESSKAKVTDKVLADVAHDLNAKPVDARTPTSSVAANSLR